MDSKTLIQAYQNSKELDKQARQADEQMVKAKMAALIEAGLPVWFGEFAQELELQPGGEFKYMPGSNSDVDAVVDALFRWQGIGVRIHATAKSTKSMRIKDVGVAIVFSWPRQDLWGGTLYPKEIYLALPVNNVVEGEWMFAEARELGNVLELGSTLAQALGIENERQARIDESEDAKREVSMANWVARIGSARDFCELRESYAEATGKWAQAEQQFQAAKATREAELDERRIQEHQHAAQVAQASEWLRWWKAVLLFNRAKLAALQASWEWAHNKIQVYLLEYGVVAQDDDEGEAEKYVRVDAVYVSGKQDEQGWWTCIEGEPSKMRVMHPVRVLERAFDCEDLPACLRRAHWVEECLEYVRYPTTGKIDLSMAGMEALPVLDPRMWAKDIVDEAYRGIVGNELPDTWDLREYFDVIYRNVATEE